MITLISSSLNWMKYNQIASPTDRMKHIVNLYIRG